jgi:hypothetical protein
MLMTNKTAIADKRAIERWENEGGKVSAFNSPAGSFVSVAFRKKEKSFVRQLIDSQTSLDQRPSVFLSSARRVV